MDRIFSGNIKTKKEKEKILSSFPMSLTPDKTITNIQIILLGRLKEGLGSSNKLPPPPGC